jgi:hypothetical protein
MTENPLLQERLEKELDASKLTTVQTMDSWRRILRLTKTEELRREVEILSQQYERDVERRDAQVEAVLRDLAASEQHTLYGQRQHMLSMDELIDIQDTRPLLLEKEYRRELSFMEREFAAEREEVRARHATFRNELLHVLKAIKEEEENKTANATADFEQAREALKRRNLERMHILQGDMDATIEVFERKFEEAHLTYLANTDQRTQDYKVLSERGQHDTAMNERQQRALKRLNKLLQLWRSKAANNVRECEERNETLEAEKAAVGGHLDRLKADMARSRVAHMGRMKALSVAAAAAKAQLTEATGVAQRILSSAETLRAMESESEKVDPFAAAAGTLPALQVGAGGVAVAAVKAATGSALGTSLGAPAGVDLTASLVRGLAPAVPALADAQAALVAEGLPIAPELAAPGTGAALAEAEALHNFYGRMNKALLETLALERSRDALRAEQAELQLVLQQVLDSTGVTPSAVDGANSLLVVNGRMSAAGTARLPPMPIKIGGRLHSTEAAMVTATYNKIRTGR